MTDAYFVDLFIGFGFMFVFFIVFACGLLRLFVCFMVCLFDCLCCKLDRLPNSIVSICVLFVVLLLMLEFNCLLDV